MSLVDIVHAKIVLTKCSRKTSAPEDLQTEQDVSVTKKEEMDVKWIKNEVPRTAGVINENKNFHLY